MHVDALYGRTATQPQAQSFLKAELHIDIGRSRSPLAALTRAFAGSAQSSRCTWPASRRPRTRCCSSDNRDHPEGDPPSRTRNAVRRRSTLLRLSTVSLSVREFGQTSIQPRQLPVPGGALPNAARLRPMYARSHPRLVSARLSLGAAFAYSDVLEAWKEYMRSTTTAWLRDIGHSQGREC